MTLSTESHHAECRYVECRNDLNVMLNVFMLSAVMLSVVAPQQGPFAAYLEEKKSSPSLYFGADCFLRPLAFSTFQAAEPRLKVVTLE